MRYAAAKGGCHRVLRYIASRLVIAAAMVLLGLGTNGHTASRFPGTAVLEEGRRWVAEVYVAEEKMWRVTLTAGAINAAATVAFLVAGREKAEVLRRVREGPRDAANLPAQMIEPTDGELVWLVDGEAAGGPGLTLR